MCFIRVFAGQNKKFALVIDGYSLRLAFEGNQGNLNEKFYNDKLSVMTATMYLPGGNRNLKMNNSFNSFNLGSDIRLKITIN